MTNIQQYFWYIPAAYIAFMFGNKITEGLAHSAEFIAIISVVSPLKSIAYTIAPIVGIFDFFIGVSLLLNSFITKSNKIQKLLFVWVIIWPFIPASLRYFGGVGDFELVEVLSISIAGIVSYLLWASYSSKIRN